MSEASRIKIEGEKRPIAVAAAGAATSKITPICCIDLTLSDSDNDDGAEDSAPSPTTLNEGSYAKFSKYARSLRSREPVLKKRPGDHGTDEEDDPPVVVTQEEPPTVVTPGRRDKKLKISSSSGTSSASGTKDIELGAIGYKFHKLFYVNTEKTKTLYFHGEVVDILDKAVAKKGKDRRCVYEDGDVEYMSLIELRFLPRCNEQDCDKSLLNSIKRHGQPEGKPNTSVAASQNDSEGDDDGEDGSRNLAGGYSSIMDVDEGNFSSEDDNTCGSEFRSNKDTNVPLVRGETNGVREMSNLSNRLEDDGSPMEKTCGDIGISNAKKSSDSSGDDESMLSHKHNGSGFNDGDFVTDDSPMINPTKETPFASRGNAPANTSVDFPRSRQVMSLLRQIRDNNPGTKKRTPVDDDDSDDNKSLFDSDDGMITEKDKDDDSSDDNKSLFSGDDEMITEKGKGDDSSDDNASLFSGDEEMITEKGKGDDSSDDNASLFSRDDEMISGNESDFSRFSDIGADIGSSCPSMNVFPEKEKVGRLKKELPVSLVTDYITPPVVRREPTCYYLMVLWGGRMRVEESKDPPSPSFSEQGLQYEIVYTKLCSRKGKGPTDDRMGRKYYKSYFLAVSGPGLEDIDLKSALASIGDFESLTYEDGAHKTVSRFDLLVSPSCRIDNNRPEFCMHRLHNDMFELIDDCGHLGCGFLPKSFLVELLGKSVPAQRAFAVQVRVIGPSFLGTAKGMLAVKDGISKIQIPASMIKVSKSKTQPLHEYVAFNVKQHFPWTNQWVTGRLFDPNEKDPTEKQLKELNPICDDTQRVLRCKGVDGDVIQRYMEDFKQLTRIKHANLIGICDPTGNIPSGHVFITGIGDYHPSKVFVTRNPCTEGKDGVIVEVASQRNMSEKALQSLSKLGFGAIVFPLGDDPLPPKINDGDLDGDAYDVIWDEELLEGISTIGDNDESLGEVLSDDVTRDGMTFPHVIEGKGKKNFEVIQKIQENPDRYVAATFCNEGRIKAQIEVTREQIFEGTAYLSKVVGHRSVGKGRKSVVEFKCQWDHCCESKWESENDIRKRHLNIAPDVLVEYAQAEGLLDNSILPERLCKWLELYVKNDADIEKIVNHKTDVHGEIVVLCKWSDGTKTWKLLNDQKEDCKIEIGAYAKENNLFNEPGWEGTEGFWLEEVQDLMCKQPRARDIKLLMEKCHARHVEAFKEFGGHHHDTIIWGRARKKATEMEKHDVRLKLPRHLYYKLPKTLRENHAEIL